MKQYYLTTSPSGIGLIPKENMPPTPEAQGWESGRSRYPDIRSRYEAALKQAISEAVPVADQCKEKAYDMMWRNDPDIHNPVSFGNWRDILLPKKTNPIYGPFTGEYSFDDRCGQHFFNSLFCGSCGPGKCKEPVRVAILSEPEEKDPVKESQEDDLKEKIEFIKGAFQCYVGYESTDGLLKFLEESKFTITRKHG